MPAMHEVDCEPGYAAAPQTGGRRREEGSILSGLGNLLDGDGQ